MSAKTFFWLKKIEWMHGGKGYQTFKSFGKLERL